MLKQKSLILGGIIILYLIITQGCTPFVNPPKPTIYTPKAGYGTMTGAEYGAIAGAATSVSAAATAGAGAIVGLGVGSYLTSTSKLLAKLQQDGITVVQIGDAVRIIIPTDKLFEYDNAEIIPQSYYILDDVVAFLKRYGNVPITITGYTDNVYSADVGVPLSLNRAKSVVAYLWSHGIIYKNLFPVGKGSGTSIASNGNPIASTYNRRIELTFPVVYYHWAIH